MDKNMKQYQDLLIKRMLLFQVGIRQMYKCGLILVN